MHKFVYENDYEGQLSTTVEFTVPSDADLNDMLEQFEYYLKAIGFSFDGNVDIVPEHSFDDTVREPVFEKGYPSYDAVNSKKKLWDATPEEWNAAAKWTQDYTGTGQYMTTPYDVSVKMKND